MTTVKVKNKRTKREGTIEVSDNLQGAEAVKAHIERVMPTHDFVEIVTEETKPAKK